MKKIFITAGHSKKKPGSSSKYGKEAVEAIQRVNEAAEFLRKQDTTRKIIIVPHNLALVGAVDWVNARCNQAYDLAIEVHYNANVGNPGTGTETYYGLKQLAEELQNPIVETLELANRGVKKNNLFYWNRCVKCASALVELGFINNKKDFNILEERGGLALAKGVMNTMGLIYKEPQKPKPTKPTEPTKPTKPNPPPTPKPVKPKLPKSFWLNLVFIIEQITNFIKKLKGDKKWKS